MTPKYLVDTNILIDYLRGLDGTDLIDSILAASAQNINVKLVTLNKKHFPMLAEIVIPYKRK